MPEGDILFRIAATLRKTIGGQNIVEFRSTLPALADAGLAGHVVAQIQSLGKNLLIHLDDGRTILTHLKMTGSWHVYRPQEKWRKPAHTARLSLHTEPWVAVCFNAPVVELLRPREVERHPMLRDLGPDLLAPTPDLEEAYRRLARSERPLGEAILDQRIAAGIGNVYKSELLFLLGLNPFELVPKFSQAQLRDLLYQAVELMQRNVRGGPRVTRARGDGRSLWVYGRAREPCLRCGEPVAMRRQGDAGRSTYYCPRCQGVSFP